MRIGVAGLAGRVGRLLVEEIITAGHTVSGGTIRPDADADADADTRALPPDIAVFTSMALLAAQSDLVIDFTHASTVRGHATCLAAAGTPWVLGTTGLDDADDAAVRAAASSIAVMHAPNYAPGMALMLALVERMAAALPATAYDAEIMELHHRHKRDAPSGTALGLGRAVASGRGQDLRQVMESGRHGDAVRKPGAIGFATLRGGEVAGEHSVLFASAAEHLTLSHRAFDRRVFATGAVQAAGWLHNRPPGLYGMHDVLGLR